MKLVTPLALLCALCCCAGAATATPEYPLEGPDIYDTKADGFALIDAALKQAKAENKNVLLDFGANWCPWCHRLHTLFTTDKSVAAVLAHDYVVVMIDVNMKHIPAKRNYDVNLKYDNPIHEGLPVLVVLDADGNKLVTQETGALEEGKGHDPKKVIAFLEKWAPKR